MYLGGGGSCPTPLDADPLPPNADPPGCRPPSPDADPLPLHTDPFPPPWMQTPFSKCRPPPPGGRPPPQGHVTCQGSHSDWKTWKNEKAFSSQGKVREF